MDRQFYFLLLYLISFLIILGLSEWGYKRLKVKAAYTRKISHISSSLVSLTFVCTFQSHWWVLILAVLCFLLLFAGKQKKAFQSIDNESHDSMGSYLLPAGIYLSFLFYDVTGNSLLFILPCLILALSDPFAGITGILLEGKAGYITIRGRTLKKTYYGTLVFLVTTMILSLFTFYFFRYPAGQIVVFSLITAFFSAFIEMISPRGTDNVTIPLGTCLVLICLI
jgi:phytol kinase